MTTAQINPPFRQGDRVLYGDEFGLVLECTRDALGWNVTVCPEATNGPTFQARSQQLLLARREVPRALGRARLRTQQLLLARRDVA